MARAFTNKMLPFGIRSDLAVVVKRIEVAHGHIMTASGNLERRFSASVAAQSYASVAAAEEGCLPILSMDNDFNAMVGGAEYFQWYAKPLGDLFRPGTDFGKLTLADVFDAAAWAVIRQARPVQLAGAQIIPITKGPLVDPTASPVVVKPAE